MPAVVEVSRDILDFDPDQLGQAIANFAFVQFGGKYVPDETSIKYGAVILKKQFQLSEEHANDAAKIFVGLLLSKEPIGHQTVVEKLEQYHNIISEHSGLHYDAKRATELQTEIFLLTQEPLSEENFQHRIQGYADLFSVTYGIPSERFVQTVTERETARRTFQTVMNDYLEGTIPYHDNFPELVHNTLSNLEIAYKNHAQNLHKILHGLQK